MKHVIGRLVNRVLGWFGLSLVSQRKLVMLYQHDYGTGGYEKYRQLQIFHNKRKIDQVWADKQTITAIADYLKVHVQGIDTGLCHGTRGGYEQAEFSRQLGCQVVGTEISDTAARFANTVQWDFHEQKDEWRERFAFVYSNSLDQAFDPQKALATWTAQLRRDGLLFIEHTMAHSAEGASEMDPFGVHPMVMPYLLFQWGRGDYALADILELTHERKQHVWIFVIRRAGSGEMATGSSPSPQSVGGRSAEQRQAGGSGA